MTQEQIHKRREVLLGQLERLNDGKRIVQADLRNLKMRCKHPNEFKTSHMGDPCTHCPDCGNCP